MTDQEYEDLVTLLDQGKADAADAVEAEARARDDRSVLLRVELWRGPAEKQARQSGDHRATARAVLRRGPSPLTWDRLVREVSRWPDSGEVRAAVADIAGLLDDIWPDALRQAPRAWWNALQQGQPAPGWPLVRALVVRTGSDGAPFARCGDVAPLAALRIIDADDRYVAPDQLGGAGALRELSYGFERLAPGEPERLHAIGGLAGLERLRLTLMRLPVDLAPLARLGALRTLSLELIGELVDGVTGVRVMQQPVNLAPLARLGALRELSLDVQGRMPEGSDILAGLGNVALERLSVVSQERLLSLDALRGLAGLRALSIDRPPLDLAPIARLTALDELALYRLERWPEDFALPASVRALRLSECPGLGSLRGFAHARGLERLELHDCPDLIELRVSGFAALARLSVVAAGVVEIGDIDAAESLETVELRGLDALERITATSAEQGALREVIVSRCPRLHDVSGLASAAALDLVVLESLDSLADLSALAAVGGLAEIVIHDCPALTSVAPLATVPGLRTVAITRCPNIGDAEALRSLDGVTVELGT